MLPSRPLDGRWSALPARANPSNALDSDRAPLRFMDNDQPNLKCGGKRGSASATPLFVGGGRTVSRNSPNSQSGAASRWSLSPHSKKTGRREQNPKETVGMQVLRTAGGRLGFAVGPGGDRAGCWSLAGRVGSMPGRLGFWRGLWPALARGRGGNGMQVNETEMRPDPIHHVRGPSRP